MGPHTISPPPPAPRATSRLVPTIPLSIDMTLMTRGGGRMDTARSSSTSSHSGTGPESKPSVATLSAALPSSKLRGGAARSGSTVSTSENTLGGQQKISLQACGAAGPGQTQKNRGPSCGTPLDRTNGWSGEGPPYFATLGVGGGPPPPLFCGTTCCPVS